MAWLSLTELDRAVVLGSDWLVSVIMVLVCLPSDASRNTYHLTWVSLTSDVGYLLTAAPPDLEHGVAPLNPPVPSSSHSLEVG